MTKLDLIIFLADYIEPCRSFPGLEEVREAAKSDLYYASYLVSRNTIHYLSSKNRLIYPDAFYAYNDLRSEEHTSELQSRGHLVCRLLLEKKKKTIHGMRDTHIG